MPVGECLARRLWKCTRAVVVADWLVLSRLRSLLAWIYVHMQIIAHTAGVLQVEKTLAADGVSPPWTRCQMQKGKKKKSNGGGHEATKPTVGYT